MNSKKHSKPNRTVGAERKAFAEKVCFICSEEIEETQGWSHVVWNIGPSELYSDMWCLFELWMNMTQDMIDKNIPAVEDSE